MKRCTSRHLFTGSSNVWLRQRLSHGCWHTLPVEAGRGFSMMTDTNASSSPILFCYSCRNAAI